MRSPGRDFMLKSDNVNPNFKYFKKSHLIALFNTLTL